MRQDVKREIIILLQNYHQRLAFLDCHELGVCI